MSKYGVFFGPNAGIYGPEKTPYLDTFHAAKVNEENSRILSTNENMLVNIGPVQMQNS